jgi:transglutaminase-like putative cysteine protease
VRLTNFSRLEAIVPNTACVTALPTAGEYRVAVGALTRPTVAFGYKAQVNEANMLAYAPLILRPVWRRQQDRLAVVLHYELNPAFAATTPFVLSDVLLVVSYAGAAAASCQTKPAGTHLRDRKVVYWRLDSGSAAAGPQKVIARLEGPTGATTASADASADLLRGAGVEARWVHACAADVLAGTGLGVCRRVDDDPFADAEGSPVAVSVADGGGHEGADDVSSPAPGGRWEACRGVRRAVQGRYDADGDGGV